MTDTTASQLALTLIRRMRSQRVADDTGMTGLDHVAVSPVPPRGFQLTLFFVPQEETGEVLLPVGLDSANLRIVRPDGTALPGVWVKSVEKSEAQGEAVYVAALATEDPAFASRLANDLSQYVLEIVEVPGVDRFLSKVFFSFSGVPVGAPDFGLPLPSLPPPADIDYLVKDFQSFRKLMLDRMALLLPEWPERNPVDLGVAIVEVLAYAADYLSYYQDAVATEAYLETARERISVRRHVRLLDYTLHEGCNARVWLGIRPGTRPAMLPEGTEVLTGGTEEGTVAQGSERYQRMIAGGAQVFETLYELPVLPQASRLFPYAWGLSDYVLPAGSHRASLKGAHEFGEGEVLVIRQALDPQSGRANDVDLRRAWAVRLREPSRQGRDGGKEITEIVWHEEDALPFDLWVTRETRSGVHADLAEVYGNVVLADHGRTVCEELTPVPPEGVYTPFLTERNLVYSVPFDCAAFKALPAQAALAQNPVDALPAIRLYEVNERYFYPQARRAQAALPSKAFGLASSSYGGAAPRKLTSPMLSLGGRFARVFEETLGLKPGQMPRAEVWVPRHDLLQSGRFARNFVVETGEDGRARLRFGDGTQGLAPDPGSRFWAVYRVGSPPRGNVGPRTVTQLVLESGGAGIAGARNDVAASGGTLPEDVEVARNNAPQAFHVQQRCVTEGDYVTLAEKFPGVYKAQCVKSWNGSGTTALVSVQREGGRPVDESFREKLDLYLRPFLLLGHEMEVREPQRVPLAIVLAVQVEPSHLRSSIRDDLLDVLGDRRLPDGRFGFFYPDRFTFGQPVYLSELIATAMGVHGVSAVEAVEFHRLGREQGNELETGRIEIGRLEIAQCRNDPAVPRLGTIELQLTGGQ